MYAVFFLHIHGLNFQVDPEICNFTSFNLGHHDKAVKLTEILFIIAEYVWCENGRNKSKSFYNIEQSFIDYIKNFPLNQIDLS